MALLTLAVLGKTFGLEGGIKGNIVTDFPAERFKKGKSFVLVSPKGERKGNLTLGSYRSSSSGTVFFFKEVETIEEAEALRGFSLCLEEEDAPLPEGAYRLKDLEGCAIVAEGKTLGKVKEVLRYSSTPVFRVERSGEKDFFVPFVYKTFVNKVDIEKKEIDINLVEGML